MAALFKNVDDYSPFHIALYPKQCSLNVHCHRNLRP